MTRSFQEQGSPEARERTPVDGISGGPGEEGPFLHGGRESNEEAFASGGAAQ